MDQASFSQLRMSFREYGFLRFMNVMDDDFIASDGARRIFDFLEMEETAGLQVANDLRGIWTNIVVAYLQREATLREDILEMKEGLNIESVEIEVESESLIERRVALGESDQRFDRVDGGETITAIRTLINEINAMRDPNVDPDMELR